MLNCDPDSDNDGVSDSQDDYPNDATRAFDNYYPNNVNRGTHMFEDLWPAQGDFDLNDLVLRYRYNMVTNASNEAVELVADYQVVALGAGYNNSFGVALPVLPNQVASVTGSELTGSFIRGGNYSF